MIVVHLTSFILAIYTTGICALPQQVKPMLEGAFAKPKGNVISRYLTDAGEGTADIINGLFSVVAHPIETIKNIGHTIVHLIKTCHSIASNTAQDWRTGQGKFPRVKILNYLIINSYAFLSKATTNTAAFVISLTGAINEGIAARTARITGDGADLGISSKAAIKVKLVQGLHLKKLLQKTGLVHLKLLQNMRLVQRFHLNLINGLGSETGSNLNPIMPC